MTVEELQVRISAEIDDLKRGCEDAKRQLNQVSVSAGKMGDAIKSAFSVAKILAFAAAVVKVSKDCTQAYTTQFNAEQKLTTAMKANLNATDNQITSIKKLTSAQQELGVVGDEAQLAGVAQLSMYKLQISSIEKLIPAMNDLIVARDGLNASVGTATDMGKKFAETLNGETESLKEVGIYFTEAEKKILQYGTEADKVNLIIQKVNNTVGNMNANMADTPLGQIQQLNNLMGDIKEQIGQIVSNLTATVIPVLSDILSWVSNILDYAVAFSEVFYEVFGGSKIKVDKNKSGVDNLANSISSVKEEAVEAKKALYALAGFDELNILNYNKSTTSGSKKPDTSIDKESNSVQVSVSANADLAKQNIKDIIAELQKSLEGLDINVSTDEAQQKLDDFKNKWTERLKEFLAVVEADPDNAVNEFIKLQNDFDKDYSQLVTEVEADTTDGGKALKDFKTYWDNQLGQLKISIVVSTDNVQQTDAETALKNIKNIAKDLKNKLSNVTFNLSTKEAQKALEDYRNQWSDYLDDFVVDVEANPQDAQKKFEELKKKFNDSYKTFVMQVGADTTDGGKSLKTFKEQIDKEFNKFAINVVVLADTGEAGSEIEKFKKKVKKDLENLKIRLGLDDPVKVENIKQLLTGISELLLNLTSATFEVVLSFVNEIDPEVLADLIESFNNLITAAKKVLVPLAKLAGLLANEFIVPGLIQFFNDVAGALNGISAVIDFICDPFGSGEKFKNWCKEAQEACYETADKASGCSGAFDAVTEALKNAGNPIYQLKVGLGSLMNLVDAICEPFIRLGKRLGLITDNTIKYTGSILDQVDALNKLKDAADSAHQATSLFDTSYSYAESHDKNGRILNPVAMPNKNTVPKANTTNNSYTTNYHNSKTSNVSQVFYNTSKDNTKDILDAIDKLGRDIDESNKNNRTVIGDEDIARSANRGNNRIKNRAAAVT